MKPWLFDILACPIDKHFPLTLTIFSYETEASIFSSYIEEYEKPNSEKIKSQKLIEVSNEEDQLFVKDNIVLEKKNMEEYLDSILKSISEMNNFTDKSNIENAKKCFNIIINEVQRNIMDFRKKEAKDSIDEIIPELIFVNRMKIEIEIESGILFCVKCNRWYPIIDTIPQMLPDEYRDKKKDLQFLKAKKNLLNQEILNKELKPFNL